MCLRYHNLIALYNTCFCGQEMGAGGTGWEKYRCLTPFCLGFSLPPPPPPPFPKSWCACALMYSLQHLPYMYRAVPRNFWAGEQCWYSFSYLCILQELHRDIHFIPGPHIYFKPRISPTKSTQCEICSGKGRGKELLKGIHMYLTVSRVLNLCILHSHT